MKIIITIEERDQLLKLLGDRNSILRRKLLKETRKRKEGRYKKCKAKEDNLHERIKEIIESNYAISNKNLIQRLGISKALFYQKYNQEAKQLKAKYKSQSLF